jgi:hypothetical protein
MKNSLCAKQESEFSKTADILGGFLLQGRYVWGNPKRRVCSF